MKKYKSLNRYVKYILGLIVVTMLIAGCQHYPVERFDSDSANSEDTGSVTDLDKVSEEIDETEKTETSEDSKSASVSEKIQDEKTAEKPNLSGIDTSGIPRREVKEGELVSFPSLEELRKQREAEGDPITVTYSKPLNEQGRWQTKVGDAGEYMLEFRLSDGINDQMERLILVVRSKNQPPVIQKISDITIFEGDTVQVDPKVSDPDNDPIKVSYSGWMTENIKKTSVGDAGEYTVVVTASDGISETKEEFNVIVLRPNRKPLIQDIADIIVTEGETAKINVVAADPDGDKITVSFSTPFNEKGEWKTREGSAGVYSITVSVSDGKDIATKTAKVIVNPLNYPPTISNVPDEITINEGETIEFNPVVEDPEGKSVTVKYSGWMTSNKYTTNYNDSGEYEVVITASDGVKETSKTVKITVIDVNRPPVFPNNWWK